MQASKYLNNIERQLIIGICKANIITDTRNAVLILTALYCGLRAQELLNLTISDVDFGNKTIWVKTLKKGNPRTIPAPDCLLKYIKTLSSEVIFPISYQRLVQVWHLYRPCKKKFHSLRHTCAILLYRKTKDINLVKYVLGHKSLSSTTVYLEETYQVETLRKYMRAS
jgi:integrase/recombinase XerC